MNKKDILKISPKEFFAKIANSNKKNKGKYFAWYLAKRNTKPLSFKGSFEGLVKQELGIEAITSKRHYPT